MAEKYSEKLMNNKKIRIKFKSFDVKLLDLCVKKITDVAKASGAVVSGPVMLPTEKDIYCVQRCTTIDKESMEHFETRTHKRFIEIKNSNNKFILELTKLDLPSGVNVEIKA